MRTWGQVTSHMMDWGSPFSYRVGNHNFTSSSDLAKLNSKCHMNYSIFLQKLVSIQKLQFPTTPVVLTFDLANFWLESTSCEDSLVALVSERCPELAGLRQVAPTRCLGRKMTVVQCFIPLQPFGLRRGEIFLLVSIFSPTSSCRLHMGESRCVHSDLLQNSARGASVVIVKGSHWVLAAPASLRPIHGAFKDMVSEKKRGIMGCGYDTGWCFEGAASRHRHNAMFFLGVMI